MELITKGVLIHDLDNTEVFSIKVNEINYKLVRKRLELELNSIINIFKELQAQGKIKGLKKPRNKKIQKSINQLVDMKRTLKQSISNISEMFYK